MLTKLTDHLLKYHKVVIPGIGCFELHQHPAQLDFAEKLIHPPYYSIQYSRNENADEDQWKAFSKEELQLFGKQLQKVVTSEDVNWSGIGTLSMRHDKLHFKPAFSNNLLSSVEAHKVIHQDESHEVLRGDQSYASADLINERPAVKRRNYRLLIVEIIALLAIIYIIYHFYVHGFSVSATGTSFNLSEMSCLISI